MILQWSLKILAILSIEKYPLHRKERKIDGHLYWWICVIRRYFERSFMCIEIMPLRKICCFFFVCFYSVFVLAKNESRRWRKMMAIRHSKSPPENWVLKKNNTVKTATSSSSSYTRLFSISSLYSFSDKHFPFSYNIFSPLLTAFHVKLYLFFVDEQQQKQQQTATAMSIQKVRCAMPRIILTSP